MDQIEQALADLKLQDKLNIQATANKYSIQCSTLSKRWNGIHGSKEAGYDAQRLLDSS